MVPMVIPLFSLFLATHAREEGRTLVAGTERIDSHLQATTTGYTSSSDQNNNPSLHDQTPARHLEKKRHHLTAEQQRKIFSNVMRQLRNGSVASSVTDTVEKAVKSHFSIKGLTAIVMNLFTIVGFICHVFTIIIFYTILKDGNAFFNECVRQPCPDVINIAYFSGIVSTTVTSIYLASARSHTVFIRRVVSSMTLILNGISLLFYTLAWGEDLGYDTVFEWVARAVFAVSMPLSWYGSLPVIMSWR